MKPECYRRSYVTFISGFEEEVGRSLRGFAMSYEDYKYDSAFDKAAERLETSVDVLLSITSTFEKLFDTVYPGFS